MSHPLRVQEQNEPQKISVFASANHAADAVAANLLSTVRGKPKSIPGLAIGLTPCRAGRGVSRRGGVFPRCDDVQSQRILRPTRIPPDSFAAFMPRALFGLADFAIDRINLIDRTAADAAGEAARYAALLRKIGGADVQLLGLGTNGHIGFNEPGSPCDSRVRVVGLCEETLFASRPRLIELEAAPARAIIMGIADILNAREIIVLATGPAKAKSVRHSLRGSPGVDCAESFLLSHPKIHLYRDSATAAELD